jgi:preprotein translocase subunit YajC
MLISTAYAQTGGDSTSMLVQIAPLVLIFVVFYFLLIRPQQKKAKEHRAMLDAVKRGDVVVTSGGLVGKVVHVDGDELGIELAPNVRIRQIKSMIAQVRAKTEPGAAPAAPPKPEKSDEPAKYYRTLGLKADATAAEIATAAAAKAGEASAEDAIETLKDPVKRKLYDRLGHDEYVATVKG